MRHSHFAHSAKRLGEYKQFQSFANTEPHKILKPSQSRWLSLKQCVRRLLEQWPALELNFQKSAEKDCLVTSQNIYDPTLEKGPYGALCNFRLWASKVNTGAPGQN